MEKVKIIVSKNGEKETIDCSKIFMGSADFLREDNMSAAEKVLDRYVELGGNTFDTARHYRHSEKALGIWIENRRNREAIRIETKCCHPVREAPNTPRVTPAAIEEDLMTSLELLKTDYVEFLGLHRDDSSQPVGPIMEALHKQVLAGRVKGVGVSNWELPRIIEAQKYCLLNGLTPLAFDSPNLSLATINKPRWADCVTANQEMKNWHLEKQLPLFAWSSQAEGFFASRFQKEDQSNEEIVEVYYNEENWEKLTRVNQLAEKKDCLPIQLSLAYVLNQPFPTFAVIGSENLHELESSVNASRIKLTEAEMKWLDLK